MTNDISNHTLMYSPIRGGIAIQNPVVGNYGTAGFVATSDDSDRWIVSCYHVLCRLTGEMPPNVSEPIHYPFDLARQSPVAYVSTQKSDKDLDCAAAFIPHGVALGEILGIGKLSQPGVPVIGMRVIKAGAETGVTEGRILRVSESEVEITPFGMPPRYELSEGGDSGAVWVDAATYAPVALHFKGSERGTAERAFGRPILAVLDALKLRLVID